MRLADSELRSLKRKANYTRRKAPWQNESRRVGMKLEAQVVVKHNFQKWNALEIDSWTIQSRHIGIVNYPRSEAERDLTLSEIYFLSASFFFCRQ